MDTGSHVEQMLHVGESMEQSGRVSFHMMTN